MRIFRLPAHYYLLAALLLKIIYLLAFVNYIRLWEDHIIAVNIVNKGEFLINMDGVNNHSFQFPVYPCLIAALYKLFGIQPLVACLYNIIINTLCGFVLVKLMKELIAYLQPAGLNENQKNSIITISLLLFILHPAINFYTLYNVHPFMQNMFFLMLAAYFAFRHSNDLNYRKSVVFGLVLGMAILDRGTALMALIPFALIGFKRYGLKPVLKHGAVICSAGFLLCLPWLIHNYITDGFIGLESSAGKDMYKGILENSDGSNYLANGKNYYDGFEKNVPGGPGVNAAVQNAYYMNKIIEKWKSDPGFSIKMFLLKLKNFWWFRSMAGNEQSRRVQNFIPVYKAAYALLLLLVVASFFFAGKRMLVILSMPVAISCLQAAFYVETRHRIIIEPLLIFIALTSLFMIFTRLEPYLSPKGSGDK